MLNFHGLEGISADNHSRDTVAGESGANAGGWRNERHDRNAHSFDQPQVMTREVAIEQLHRSLKGQYPSLLEAHKRLRRKARYGDGLDQLEFALVFLEAILIELSDILQQTSGASEPTSVWSFAVWRLPVLRWGLPVICPDERWRCLLALERKLI